MMQQARAQPRSSCHRRFRKVASEIMLGGQVQMRELLATVLDFAVLFPDLPDRSLSKGHASVFPRAHGFAGEEDSYEGVDDEKSHRQTDRRRLIRRLFALGARPMPRHLRVAVGLGDALTCALLLEWKGSEVGRGGDAEEGRPAGEGRSSLLDPSEDPLIMEMALRLGGPSSEAIVKMLASHGGRQPGTPSLEPLLARLRERGCREVLGLEHRLRLAQNWAIRNSFKDQNYDDLKTLRCFEFSY